MSPEFEFKNSVWQWYWLSDSDANTNEDAGRLLGFVLLLLDRCSTQTLHSDL